MQEQHHVVTSIDWKVILQKPEGEQTIFTPKSARIYIANVVRRMNSHFGIFMNGADIGRLRISIFDFLIVFDLKLILASNENKTNQEYKQHY